MKVLMVCLGNICRSPLAEGILKNKQPDWEVDSAGTSRYHMGEHPDNRSIQEAKKHNIDISKQNARQISRSDLKYFDLILAMDTSNYNDILSIAETQEERNKVHLILNYLNPGMNESVPDPYYNNGFGRVYKLLDAALDELVNSYK